MDFVNLVNEQFAVYICNNFVHGQRCEAHILLADDVKTIRPDSITAEDDKCINTYDEPTKTVYSSANPVDGCNIHCLKCDGTFGVRNGSHIVFDPTKLVETMFYNYNQFFSDLLK